LARRNTPWPTNAKGQRICGAKKKSGGRCGVTNVFPNGRCYHHGGPTPSGIAHPAFKTGRYSQHLPSALADRYQESLRDPELLDLRHEVALLDVRITEVLARLETGETSARWQRARDAFRALGAAITVRDRDLTQAAMTDLAQEIETGGAEADVWAELVKLIYHRRKLVDSESRRRQVLHQMISLERAMAWFSALADVVRRHVPERERLQAIQTEMSQLMTIPAKVEVRS
jgi:hypothetical protein